MDAQTSITLAGVIIAAVMLTLALGTIIRQNLRDHTERAAARVDIAAQSKADQRAIMVRFDAGNDAFQRIEDHLATLNGSVAEVKKTANDNSVAIAGLIGRHAHLDDG
jgi:hypothetical protein